VAGSIVENKLKGSPTKDVTSDTYYAAYNTILDMLVDRGADQASVDSLRRTPSQIKTIFDSNQLDQLNIGHFENKRGQYMYVYFLDIDNQALVKKRSGSGKSLPQDIINITNDTVATYNSRTGSSLVQANVLDPKSADHQTFMNKVEVIIVFNNKNNETILKLEGSQSLPVQIFSAQQLVFNITRHADQPSFFLLDPKDISDRAEILDVLSLNGLVLEGDKTLGDYNIRDGAKLILV
jgi:hypothetical protein